MSEDTILKHQNPKKTQTISRCKVWATTEQPMEIQARIKTYTEKQ